MSEQFEPGDVVELKSGGPKMTIKWVATRTFQTISAGDCHCVWFEGATLKESGFPPTALKKTAS
jgi:uncharacterized protein YodC (DUF2158 family)